MPKCINCGDYFPRQIKLDNGKLIATVRRHYCLKCSPMGNKLFNLSIPVNMSIAIKCASCGDDFNDDVRYVDCKKCRQNKYRLYCINNRTEKRNKAIEMMGGKCSVCGYNKCSKALEFHHINQDNKEFTLSSIWGLKWEKIEKEISKCVLLCSICHGELHAGLIKL